MPETAINPGLWADNLMTGVDSDLCEGELMVARPPDNRQRHTGAGRRDSTQVGPRAGRRAALTRWSPALRRLLFDPDSDVTYWCSPDGAAEVIYHPSGDYFSWSIDGRRGCSDMHEDVLAALVSRSTLSSVPGVPA